MSGRKYVFPANDLKIESAAFTFGPKGNAATLALQINGVEQKVECGDGAWSASRRLAVTSAKPHTGTRPHPSSAGKKPQ